MQQPSAHVLETPARPRSRTLRWVGLLAVGLAIHVPMPAFAQVRNVLVLETGAAGRPVANDLTRELSDALAAVSSPAAQLAVYFEWLDLDRFAGDAYAAKVRGYLADKYLAHPPDVLVALGDPTIHLLAEWRPATWPDTPLLFAANSQDAADLATRAGRATGLVTRLDGVMESTLRAVMTLLPSTDEVVLVAAGDVNLAVAERSLQVLPPGVRVTRLVDLPIEDIEAGVARASGNSVIFYSAVTRDQKGRGFNARTVLDRLGLVARRPIFSYVGTFLDHGIVGGALADPRVTMRQLAPLITRVASGTPTSDIPVASAAPRPLTLDARQLRRWSIPDSRVPAGSDVRFRERNVLEEYRGTIIAAASVLAAQTVTILALLFEVRRRQQAQAQQRRLSARVLSAQEEERSRIAQELHDSSSQQLALLAIELDQLGAAPGMLPEARARTLADRARSLSSELHGLAYELHPAILDRLGLLPATHQFADRFSSSHGVRVDVEACNWPDRLPAGVELALYRVIQESLHNVARHAGAPSASVELRAGDATLVVKITDRGKGFDTATLPDVRLGLAGMAERLAHIGGTLVVESSPGNGTTVVASVSRETVALMEMDDRLRTVDPADSAGPGRRVG